MNVEFFTAVELLAKEKEISADFIYEQFRESIVKAAKRQDAEVRKQAEARRRADLRRQAFEKAELAAENGADFDEAYAEAEAEIAIIEENMTADAENVFCDINPEEKTLRI